MWPKQFKLGFALSGQYFSSAITDKIFEIIAENDNYRLYNVIKLDLNCNCQYARATVLINQLPTLLQLQ